MTDQHEWIAGLVKQYEKPLCRYAFSLTGEVAAAQDAVQETFLRLCKANRARVEGHEAAWLFRVCRSRVFDMKRKEKPMHALTPQHEALIASPEPSPDAAAMHQDKDDVLPNLMASLPDRQREVIRLKFQQNLSYREIARVMNLSESNVGFIIHTGIKTLRENMKQLQGALS
ncbi:MAG TPA: sigma-70 family RNA polymerase sigma factor [Kiritimatiellia bacterium]|nr:sigma-70 family RNA polymerase sigma factor [Kiritimatiellia bacterium]HMO97636.1 sigma-70 family RNA polymerase sigma factor [Kiritimatiellia bacterium]HMP97747.1 sigma-70 family RNA polymerase sigma factor [Kiritimatiellia bacterium]